MDTVPSAIAINALLTSSSSALGALAGAIDDLHRAAFIHRQGSRPMCLRFRAPDDLRRIADQFSERARSRSAIQEIAAAACREFVAASRP